MLGNKMYIVGGSVKESNLEDFRGNSDVFVVDFSKSGDFTADSNLVSAQTFDDSIHPPEQKLAVLWGYKDTLIYSQGALAKHPAWDFTTNAYVQSRRPTMEGDIWKYSINDKSWKRFPPSPEVPFSASLTGSTFSAKTGKGYIVGGSLEPNIHDDPAGKGFKTPGSTQSPESLRQLLIYDAAEDSWKNVTTPITLGFLKTPEVNVIENAGEKGVLVVFGGLVKGQGRSSAEVDADISVVHLYDIATEKWYTQDTSGPNGLPAPRTQGCSVVVSAPDNSSHNIYVIGGNDASKKVHGEVWVLSIPSFTWTRVNADMHRSGLTCQLVNNRYAAVFGGRHDFGENCDLNDDAPKGVELFDLVDLEWTLSFDSEKNQYKVPRNIYSTIGGSENGNATLFEPEGGFRSKSVEALFLKNDETSPNAKPKSNSKDDNDSSDDEDAGSDGNAAPKKDGDSKEGDKKSSKTPIIVGAVIGVAVALGLSGLILFIARRRQQKKKSHPTEACVEMEAKNAENFYAPNPSESRLLAAGTHNTSSSARSSTLNDSTSRSMPGFAHELEYGSSRSELPGRDAGRSEMQGSMPPELGGSAPAPFVSSTDTSSTQRR
ncbi:hypothetical protein BJ508DRAFT_6954 [Ascobolus immersus RN42]|uniref:Galactose oxidase n=1 Tax=Ascobolus immersus RN42 TaxID=1160509 RepID=A0A3N4IMA0_ASCIM|nr:hypothetical protein BJ508DRAFT_6954 [Ascobolus immersus RN42]